jgi:hypothetical protein
MSTARGASRPGLVRRDARTDARSEARAVAPRREERCGGYWGSTSGRPKRGKTLGVMNAIISFTRVASRVSTSSASAA